MHERHPQDEQSNRKQRVQNFQLGGPEKLIGADDPRHAMQENGGLADFWYFDNGDILCHPILVLPCLQSFDTANAQMLAERNTQKTEVIYYVSDLDIAPPGSKINEVRPLASVDMVTQFFKIRRPLKFLMKLGKGHTKNSFQNLLRTVRNKPHSAPAKQVLGTREHKMLPAQQQLASCHSNLCWRDWTLGLRRPPPPA